MPKYEHSRPYPDCFTPPKGKRGQSEHSRSRS
jgi:hypothetical protein